jgi:hypothetical protein
MATAFQNLVPRIMGDLILDFGLSPIQAAAVLGNLAHESAGFTAMQERNPVGGGRGGLGWAQWTGPRRRAFEAWVSKKGFAPDSYAANYGYLKAELSGAVPGFDYRSSSSKRRARSKRPRRRLKPSTRRPASRRWRPASLGRTKPTTSGRIADRHLRRSQSRSMFRGTSRRNSVSSLSLRSFRIAERCSPRHNPRLFWLPFSL